MDEIQSDEALRIWLINHLARKLAGQAILKGGMVLRLLNCPRYTNDVDYVMIPFRSKNEIIPLLQRAFHDIPQIKLSYKLHSTNARFLIKLNNQHGLFQTQLEANVAKDCDQESISTGDIAMEFHLQPQIVSVMRFDTALAHKLAAWNERDLLRDLYDAYFIHKNLNVFPNRKVLERRLQKINYAKRVKGEALPKKMSLDAFWEKLRQKIKSLTQKEIDNELRDYFEPTQLLGLDKKIKVVVYQMIDSWETDA
jgi:predicted nucleotidyltransferase component of viral defense system